MKTIAILGTGIMGAGMASNYLKHGYTVYVWNRSAGRLAPLVAAGAIAVATPKEAAEKADIVFDVTPDDAASRTVWLGEEGILAGARPRTVLIASGTFSIPWTNELARMCAERGHIHFDIPLTGSRMGAEGGTMTLLAGGGQKALDALRPDLEAISTKVYYFGKSGSGMRFKLILNMLQAVHVAGLGEALRMAKASGMDIEAVGTALADRPGGVITNLAWNAYRDAPKQTNFAVKWIDKDLHYAKDFSAGLSVPLLDGVLKHFDTAVDKGLGEEDWTASNIS